MLVPVYSFVGGDRGDLGQVGQGQQSGKIYVSDNQSVFTGVAGAGGKAGYPTGTGKGKEKSHLLSA